MPKIHILESNNAFGYKIAVHFTTPIGNNSANKSWKSCGLMSGLIGTTILSVGTEPSNITQAEYDSIITGDIIEIIKIINPGINPTNISVEELADICINEWKVNIVRTLKYYGHTIEGA